MKYSKSYCRKAAIQCYNLAQEQPVGAFRRAWMRASWEWLLREVW